jgi:hypothetical protein
MSKPKTHHVAWSSTEVEENLFPFSNKLREQNREDDGEGQQEAMEVPENLFFFFFFFFFCLRFASMELVERFFNTTAEMNQHLLSFGNKPQ